MRIKVAILVDFLVAGGVQKAAFEEAFFLRRLGFETKIVSLTRRGYNKDFVTKKIEYEFLEDRYPKFLRWNFKFPIFHFFSVFHLISPFIAPYRIKKAEFDLIVAHNNTTGITALTISKLKQIPYFLVVHDPASYILDKIYKKNALGKVISLITPIVKYVEKKISKNAEMVFTDSNVHRNFLLKNYGINSKTLYLGVEPQKNPVHLGQDFISLSRWDLGKNPQLILNLAQKLKNQKFIVAGKWTSETELKSFSQDIKNRKLNNVVLETNTDKLSKKDLFENKLAFVHPHFEAFGLGALEAASFGLPVIIPQKSGVTEILPVNKGLQPPKATSQNLLDSVLLLIKNPKTAGQIAKSNFLQANNYTWEKHSKLLGSYIKKTVDRPIETAILETGHINLQFLAGGDIILQKLLEPLTKKLNISVITTSFGQTHWKKNGSVKTQAINNQLEKVNSQFGIFLIYAKRSLKSLTWLNKLKPQLIISTTDIFPDVLPALCYKLTRPKTKWVAWVHHLIPPPHKRKGHFLTNLSSFLLQLVSLVAIRISSDITICRNKSIFDQLKKYGFNTRKLRIIDTGVDFNEINSYKAKRKYNYDALFVGRLNLLKGILDIPAIWKNVKGQIPGAKLAIIGSTNTEEFPLLGKKITDFKLQGNVDILGTVTKTTLLDVLKSSKVLLITDYEAGFSLATSEALAAGIPVIAYDLPIFGTVYKKGYLKTKLGDTTQMAQEIVKLLKDPNLQKKLSAEGISEAKKLDIKRTIQSFGKIVNEIT